MSHPTELSKQKKHVFSFCDIVIYNKQYIFGLWPHSWHREVPGTERYRYLVNEVTFGLHVRMRAGCQNQHCVPTSNPPTHPPHTSTLTPTSREGKGTGSWTHHHDQWFNRSCLCNEVSIKSHKDRVWRECWEQVSSESFPMPCLMYFSIWRFLSQILLYGNLVNKMFLWVLWPILAKKLNPRKESLGRSRVDNLGFQLTSKVEGWELNLWNLMLCPDKCVRIELICIIGHPHGVWELLGVEKHSHKWRNLVIRILTFPWNSLSLYSCR